MVRHLLNPSADAMARHMGFSDAQTASAYYQKQQAMRTQPGPDFTPTASVPTGGSPASSGSLLDRILAIHPAILLNHVINGFSQAGQ